MHNLLSSHYNLSVAAQPLDIHDLEHQIEQLLWSIGKIFEIEAGDRGRE